MATTPQSRKARGRKLQQELRDAIIESLGVDPEDVESRSMGAGGEDLILAKAARKLFPFSPECKNQEKLNIWGALEQAEKNSEFGEPLLVFKRNRSKTYAVLQLPTLLKLLNAINNKDSDSKGARESVPKTKVKRRKVSKVPNIEKV